MAGDARRKGGVYSDNPSTMRTRAYHASLDPEKAKARKDRFSEYRALRGACIRVSQKQDYIKEPTRDGKLACLRQACKEMIAQRESLRKEVVGLDIEGFIARFHDNNFLKRAARKSSSNRGRNNNYNNNTSTTSLLDALRDGVGASTSGSSSAGEHEHEHDHNHDHDDSEMTTMTMMKTTEDLDAAIAQQGNDVADVANEVVAQGEQLRDVHGQLARLADVVNTSQNRLDAIDEDNRRFQRIVLSMARYFAHEV